MKELCRKISAFFHSKKGRHAAVALVCLALLIGFIAWMIHSNTIPTLTEVVIPAEGLPTAFDGLRIVHISDLHDAELGENHEKTLALIRDASPDLILLTGDMISRQKKRTDIDLTASFCREAMKIAPCYYVTGNHEGAISAETYAELEAVLLSLGVTVLHGEAVTLERGGERITVAGVDSPDFRHGAEGKSLSELCGEGYTILLAHHPEFVSDYAEAGADLVFSGHVHGGQIRFPFVGAVFGPGQGFFPAYESGLYSIPTNEGETLLYVSRGLGNSGIQIRFANRPEVVLAVLRRS